MTNKALFLGLVSAFLIGIPSVLAININPQNDVKCDLLSCSLSVDLSTMLTSQKINKLKNYNLSNFFVKKDLDLRYNWSGNIITFYANIRPSSSNYWLLNTPEIVVDPWFNSSLPYCNNLTYTTTSTANYTNRVVRFNITNMTGFNYDDGHDVVFINDTYNSTGDLIELPFTILETSANNWFYGFIRLDYINNNTKRNISYCYGNNTTSRANTNLVFNYASVNDSVFDDFDGTSLNQTAWNNISQQSVTQSTLTIEGGGIWREIYSESTFNTSYCFITNVSVNDVTGNSRAFGMITPSGSAPLNAYQLGYPTASKFNHRNYISGESSATTGNDVVGYQIFENCRNNSAFNQSYAQYSINHTNYVNYSGAQIMNTAKLFGYQVLTGGDNIYIGWAMIWFNPYPEPIPTYFYKQFDQNEAGLPTIKDDTIVCFKTQPVCIRLSDGFLWRKNYNVIV